MAQDQQKKLDSQRRYRDSHREEIREKAREYDRKKRADGSRQEYVAENKEKLDAHKRLWYLKNREEILKKRKEYAKENDAIIKARKKEWNQQPEVKRKKAELNRIYRVKNKKQFSARAKAWRAFQSGKITKESCRVCKSENVEMHHPDYDKALSIIWLCKQHHMELEGRTL